MAKSHASTFTGILLMLIGVVLGSFIAELTKDISFLSWLSYGQSFGIGAPNPLVVDLIIVKVTFGAYFSLTIGTILGLALSFYAWRRFF